jgi:hypothetical protein
MSLPGGQEAALDHLVVAARTLDEGAAWIRERLGVEMLPGGKHPTMGTHNRLLPLGRGAYLEVMAIDPEGGTPSRPRWFSLDDPATARLLSQGPALIHWAEQSADLEADAAASADDVEIIAFERGPYRWRMALTRDGSLPGRGFRPTRIQWDSAHPTGAMPDCGCNLVARGGPREGDARVMTPHGERTLPWRLPQGTE